MLCIHCITYLQQGMYRSFLTIVTWVWAERNTDRPDSSPGGSDNTIQLHVNKAVEFLSVGTSPQLPGTLRGHRQCWTASRRCLIFYQSYNTYSITTVQWNLINLWKLGILNRQILRSWQPGVSLRAMEVFALHTCIQVAVAQARLILYCLMQGIS